MFDVLRKAGSRAVRRAVARALTGSLLRWTWNPSGEHAFSVGLGDFRPADVDTVSDMASGRYLLGGKLVDTGGISPFAALVDHYGWRRELHGFSWLRHFTDLQDEGLRRFARTLVLDWIGRHGFAFDAEIWSLDLMSRRALNWMRHIDVITAGATPGQLRAINRTLARHVRGLRLRAPYASDPIDRLMTNVIVVAAGLCENRTPDIIARDLSRLEMELGRQFDDTGLHLTRSAAVQVDILTELVTLRQAMARRDHVHLGGLSSRITAMHTALAALTLGTGALGYFNGTGQEPTDLIYALQAAGGAPAPRTGIVGGYGILRSAGAIVIADSGLVPAPEFATRAHASALSFEFSHGSELIIGNCGPAPVELRDQSRLFRLGAAHSAPVIDRHSPARIIARGPDTGMLTAEGAPPEIDVDAGEQVLKLTSHAYEARAGVTLERWLTLLLGGDTLVGQDRFTRADAGTEVTGREITLRFHLGPGIEADREEAEENIIRLRLASGTAWSFLWEGATAEIDDSVRQSAYFGFYLTRQIVLTAPLSDELEVSWILTRLA